MLSSSPAAAVRGLCSEMRCCWWCWSLSEASEPLLVAVSDVSSSSPALCDLQGICNKRGFQCGHTCMGQAAKQNRQAAGKSQDLRGLQQRCSSCKTADAQAARDCLGSYQLCKLKNSPGERLLHHQAQGQ
jgi:hypothetical protein